MFVANITVVRHGETEENKKRIIQGQKDTSLSNVGCRQAKKAGIRLQHEKFTHVYTSDLHRAQQTCNLILEENKFTTCRVVTDTRLRERCFGIFEGQPLDTFLKEVKRNKSNSAETLNFSPSDGESIHEVYNRATDFFTNLCKNLCNEVPMNDMSDNLKDDKKEDSNEVFFYLNEADNDAEADLTDCDKNVDHSNSGSSSGYLTGGDSIEKLSQLTSNNSLDFSQDDIDSPQSLSPGPTFSLDLENQKYSNLYDPDIRSNMHLINNQSLNQAYYPNVSLSPIYEDRFLRMSSISSGRWGGSFDESDFVPLLTANILIVSHGGLIKELMKHFVETLECSIAGGKNKYYKCPFNASISKFTLSFSGDDCIPLITCSHFNDKDHLQDDYTEILEVSC